MPPNGKPYALNLRDNVIYTHTAQGCGGNPNMVYIYDLATDRVGAWGPAGGGMWGRTGPAIDSKGVMYTGTGAGPWNPENGIYGNGIIGVRQNSQTKAAELVDYYGPSNAEWLFKRDLDMQVTPAIFKYKGKELMIAAVPECTALNKSASVLSRSPASGSACRRVLIIREKPTSLPPSDMVNTSMGRSPTILATRASGISEPSVVLMKSRTRNAV